MFARYDSKTFTNSISLCPSTRVPGVDDDGRSMMGRPVKQISIRFFFAPLTHRHHRHHHHTRNAVIERWMHPASGGSCWRRWWCRCSVWKKNENKINCKNSSSAVAKIVVVVVVCRRFAAVRGQMTIRVNKLGRKLRRLFFCNRAMPLYGSHWWGE